MEPGEIKLSESMLLEADEKDADLSDAKDTPPEESSPVMFEFNNEEIWVEDPTPEKIQRLRDELASYSKLIERFLAGADQWTLETISSRLVQLTHDLYELDASTSGPLAPGYIASRILPHVAAALINVADKFFPKAHRLDTSEVGQLVFDIGRLLNHGQFTEGLLRVTNYADLLHPDSTHHLTDRVIPPHVETWLQNEAEKRMSQLKDELSKPGLTKQAAWEIRREFSHLTEILRGRYGGGYNTISEEHWEHMEWDFMLNALAGDIRSQKTLSQKAATYLSELAKDLLEDMEETVQESQGKALENETFNAHYQHIKKYVRTGELPYGYKIQPDTGTLGSTPVVNK